MADISISKLKPGDILLLHDEASNTTWKHQAIKAGQTLVALSPLRKNVGDAALVHAILWTRSNDREPQIAEASGSGIVRATDIRRGTYFVYRPRNSNLGDWAAQVAMMWAIDGKIPYNKSSSIQSVLHSSNFGPNAQARAKSYIKDAFTNSPDWATGGAFCSQFVIAAYQAAAGQIGLPLEGMLHTDAKHSSVRMLHHALIWDPGHFWKIGILHVDGTSAH